MDFSYFQADSGYSSEEYLWMSTFPNGINSLFNISFNPLCFINSMFVLHVAYCLYSDQCTKNIFRGQKWCEYLQKCSYLCSMNLHSDFNKRNKSTLVISLFELMAQ